MARMASPEVTDFCSAVLYHVNGFPDFPRFSPILTRVLSVQSLSPVEVAFWALSWCSWRSPALGTGPGVWRNFGQLHAVLMQVNETGDLRRVITIARLGCMGLGTWQLGPRGWEPRW